MISIKKYKKCIFVAIDNYTDKDNNNQSVEFTNEQLNFIKTSKIFLIYYRTDKLITNIPNTITHLVFQSSFNYDITNFLPDNLTFWYKIYLFC